MRSPSAFFLIWVTIYAPFHWKMMSIKANADQAKATSIQVPPTVEILMPNGKEAVTWNTQVRYAISVSDPEDGESRYGEINASEVLLKIEYFGINNEAEMQEKMKRAKMVKQEPEGLALIKKSTCFGCHADKTRLAGPSFSEIAERYEQKTPIIIKNLGSQIIEGSSGDWGSLEMPAHPDFTEEEAMKIADYILEQGGNNHRWIYPGLEGVFRVIEKPLEDPAGILILTASYTSQKLQVHGQHSIVLEIK